MNRHTLSRLAAAALLVGSSVVAFPSPASGESNVTSGWWNNQPGPVVGVNAGELAVARTGLDNTRMAAFRFDVPAGASQVNVALRQVRTTDPTANTRIIKACLATSDWTAASGGAWSQAPKFDCASWNDFGVLSGGKWHFNLAGAADAWETGTPNRGVVIVGERRGDHPTYEFVLAAPTGTDITVDGAPLSQPQPEPEPEPESDPEVSLPSAPEAPSAPESPEQPSEPDGGGEDSSGLSSILDPSAPDQPSAPEAPSGPEPDQPSAPENDDTAIRNLFEGRPEADAPGSDDPTAGYDFSKLFGGQDDPDPDVDLGGDTTSGTPQAGSAPSRSAGTVTEAGSPISRFLQRTAAAVAAVGNAMATGSWSPGDVQIAFGEIDGPPSVTVGDDVVLAAPAFGDLSEPAPTPIGPALAVGALSVAGAGAGWAVRRRSLI